MPEFLTSRSNQDFYAEFPTLSVRHVKTVERYGCPRDNFENASFLEGFSWGEVLNSFEEIKKWEWRDEWLAAMTEKVNSLLENKVWEQCELPVYKNSLGGGWVFALEKMRTVKVSSVKVAMLKKALFKFLALTIWKIWLPQLNCRQFVCFYQLLLIFIGKFFNLRFVKPT